MELYEVGDKPTITATFTLNGTPTNPTTVVVRARKSDGTVAVLSNTNTGPGVYTASVAIDQAGVWSWEFQGTGAVEAVIEGQFIAQDIVGGRDLIGLPQLKASLGTTASSDAALYAAIRATSVAIRNYTGRSFAIASSAETKSFKYDGSGFLTIPDASAVTTVTLDGTALILDEDYILGPDRGLVDATAVYEWVELPPTAGISPEMGFTRNLDTLWWKVKRYHTVQVTGTFGWPAVPDDVQLAAILMASARAVPGGVSQFESEQIADYGYTMPDRTRDVIPDEATQLLEPYRRIKL